MSNSQDVEILQKLYQNITWWQKRHFPKSSVKQTLSQRPKYVSFFPSKLWKYFDCFVSLGFSLCFYPLKKIWSKNFL